MGKSAIILGATGLVGGQLLKLLLTDETYTNIKLFSRSSVGLANEQIDEYIVDLMNLEHYREKFTADVVFCCIGTTKAKTKDKSKYRDIDYGIPVAAAKLAKANHISKFVVISALGADENSRIFYNRVKGDMEEAVLSQGIEKTYILQPSLIDGGREEKRIGETIAKFLMMLAQPFLVGDLKKYRAIHPEIIAKTMVWLSNNEIDEVRIPSDRIQELAERYG